MYLDLVIGHRAAAEKETGMNDEQAARAFPTRRTNAGGGRRRVQEALLRNLVDRIVSGEIAEGATLPNESEMTGQFGVSRTALREAMQYLSAQGMVRSRTRAGTTVTPRDSWNYLDPLVLDAALRFNRDARFYLSLIEARLLLEPAAAAEAARHATARQVAEIETAYEAMVEANARDNEAWSRADLDFHSAIIRASGNWVYRQFVMAIHAALLASFRLTNRASPSHENAIEMHHAVLDAIRLRRADAAREAMRHLIVSARAEIGQALGETAGGDGG